MSSQKHKKRPLSNATAHNIPATANAIVADAIPDASSDALKEEILRWIFSIFCSLSVYLVIAYLIRSVYHPDVSQLQAEARKILIEPEGARPEPVEAMLFRAGVVTMSLGLLGFYVLFSKVQFVKNLAQKPVFLFLSLLPVLAVVTLIYLDFAAQNPFVKDGGDIPQNSRDFIGKTNFDFYFDGIFLGNNLLAYTFVLLPLLCGLFFFGIKKYNWEQNKAFKVSSSVIGYGVLAAVLVACIAMGVFNFPYSFETKYNFDAVYYSMTQVYAGLPMLVDGFTNTYGLYPQFLNLIFQVIGLSVFKFSLIMSLLTGIAFAANFYSLKQFVRNNVILFLGMLTVIFFPFLNFKFGQNFDCNFALYPIRYIVPSTLVLLAIIYLKKRSVIVYWITFPLMAFFTLWNPEIGMVSYISWIVFNCFNDFYDTDGKVNVKKIFFHIGVGIGVIVCVLYLYKFLIYAFYGSSPDLSLLFGTVLVFGKVGFGLLPMTLVHPWNLMAIVLILGFVYAISRWYRKEITPRTSIVLLISMIGLGFFFYYQGRSHNWQLAQCSCFSLMLLTILGDELWERVKTTNVLSLNILFGVFLFVISFSVFEIIFNTDRIKELVYQEDDKTRQQDEQQRIESNAGFVLKNSREHQKIYMFTAKQYEDLYFDGNKRVTAFTPGLMDLFLNTDLARLENRIVDSSFDVFIEPAFCNFPFLARPLARIAASYELKGVNQSMVFLQKRKMQVPQKSFFDRPAPQVIHRKYSDDHAGTTSRANDGGGVSAVALGAEFSVELLFYSTDQIYQYATLAGNMNDSSGFIISRMINSRNFFFGINGKGVGAELPNKAWVYCVLVVHPDHFEVYQNGNLVNTFPLAQPMRPSPEKLCIGNLGFMRYYVGAISEVAISNTAMDQNQVAATWAEVKQATESK